MMNIYLVLNNNAESRFVVCAYNTETAYKLAKEKGRAGEVFDRSFLLGGTDDGNERVLKEI
jgi:hypothetical protein